MVMFGLLRCFFALRFFLFGTTVGEKPQIISVLQRAVKPSILANAYRVEEEVRRTSGKGGCSFYIVGPVETMHIKVFFKVFMPSVQLFY